MALSTSTTQPVPKPVTDNKVENGTIAASLLGMLLLTAYAAKKSRKAYRKMKRQLLWSALKLKVKSLFSKENVSDRTLLLILFGVLLLVLVLIEPVAAIIVLIVLLLLYLLGVLKI